MQFGDTLCAHFPQMFVEYKTSSLGKAKLSVMTEHYTVCIVFWHKNY